MSGAIYAIMASGLVLTYSTSGIFNFSHGAIAFVTALLFFELNTAEGWSTWAAAVVSILVFAPALGYFLDRIMFRRLSTAGEMPQIVATVGLSIALPAAAIFLVERLIGVQWLHLASPDNVLTVPGLGPTPTQSFSLGNGVSINTDQLATLAAAIVSALFLWLLVRHTPSGCGCGRPSIGGRWPVCARSTPTARRGWPGCRAPVWPVWPAYWPPP